MKLNKKVLTGALALAMGLGIAAPAVNSIAAPAGQTGITQDYRDAEKTYAAALTAKTKAEEVLKEATKDNDEASKALEKANKAIKDHKAALKDITDKLTIAVTELNRSVKDYNDLTGQYLSSNQIIDKYEVNEIDDIVEDTKVASAIKKVFATNDTLIRVKASKAAEEAKAGKLVDDRDLAQKKLAETSKALKKAQDAYDAAYDAYEIAKKVFIEEGGKKNIIDKAEANGIYVPEKPADKEDVTEKIKKQLEVNKEKLAAAKGIKMYMPESYKLYKDRIDTAIANAEKAIKQAEDFLTGGKKVALFSVAYAAEEKSEGEKVLEDLENSEKELDSVLGDVEKDSKKENEKNEAKPEEKPAEDKKEDKPVVEKKEDVKASKNVKTGVAGVAGVGAVLAAASAAYVSTKRK